MPIAINNSGAKIVATRVLEPKNSYSAEQKERILAAYHERSSMRRIQFTFRVSRNTLTSVFEQ